MQNAASPAAYLGGLKGRTKTVVSSLRRAVRAEPERVLFGFWRGQRLRHLEPRLNPGGKYEMATLELRGADALAPGMARQLVAEAVALNAQLGDPTDIAPPRARRKSKAPRK